MPSRRSAVSTRVWTHESPERVRDLVFKELSRQGYVQGSAEAPILEWHLVAKRRLLRALWQPARMSVEIYYTGERTVVTVTARFQDWLVRAVPYGVAVVYAIVLGSPCVMVLAPASIAEPLSHAYCPVVAALLAFSTLVYPGGLLPTLVLLIRLDGCIKAALGRCAYPAHATRKTPQVAPFGYRIYCIVLVATLPVLALVGTILIFSGVAYGAGTVSYVVGLTILLVWITYQKPKGQITAGHRFLVLQCVAVTYLLLAAGFHVRSIMADLSEDGMADPIIDGMCLAALVGIGLVLVWSWSAVDSSSHSFQRIARAAEFSEHRGRRMQKVLPAINGVVVLAASVAFWAGTLTVLVLAGVVDPGRALSAAIHYRYFESMPVWWLCIAFGCLASLIGMRLCSLVIFRNMVMRGADEQRVMIDCPAGSDEAHHRALQMGMPRVKFVRSGDDSAACSYLEGWLRPKCVIELGDHALKSDACPAIIAHELGHCLLRHHHHTRWLRALGLVLILDPVILTAFLDHSRNEEDADRLAVELLGGGDDAISLLVSALRANCSSETPLTYAQVLPCGFSPRPAEPLESLAWIRNKRLQAGVRALLSYLKASRILYMHPSSEYRVRALRRLNR